MIQDTERYQRDIQAEIGPNSLPLHSPAPTSEKISREDEEKGRLSYVEALAEAEAYSVYIESSAGIRHHFLRPGSTKKLNQSEAHFNELRQHNDKAMRQRMIDAGVAAYAIDAAMLEQDIFFTDLIYKETFNKEVNLAGVNTNTANPSFAEKFRQKRLEGNVRKSLEEKELIKERQADILAERQDLINAPTEKLRQYHEERLNDLIEDSYLDENHKEMINTGALDARESNLNPKHQKLSQRFYKWWAKQGGKDQGVKGKVKKALPMVGFGLVAVPVAAVSTAAAGPVGVVGVLLAARTAYKVGQNMYFHKIKQNTELVSDQLNADLMNPEGVEVARIQDRISSSNTKQAIREAYDRGEVSPVITTNHRLETKERVSRNRRRVVISSAIAAGSATLAGLFDSVIFSSDHIAEPAKGVVKHLRKLPPHSEPLQTGPVHPTPGIHKPVGGIIPEVKPVHTIVPDNLKMRVGNGEGVIQEISAYANARGKHITSAQAYLIYDKLVDTHGRHILSLNGAKPLNSVYKIANKDYGIDGVGSMHWTKGAEKLIDRQLNEL